MKNIIPSYTKLSTKEIISKSVDFMNKEIDGTLTLAEYWEFRWLKMYLGVKELLSHIELMEKRLERDDV